MRYRFLRIQWHKAEEMTTVLASLLKPTDHVVGMSATADDVLVLIEDRGAPDWPSRRGV